MSRPSRTGQDAKRFAEAVSNVPVAWTSVRQLYPKQIRERVDELVERGVTSAQLMSDLLEQSVGGDAGARISGHLRLLFRIALASGGTGDASTALVQVPPELRAVLIDEADTGDDLI